MRPAAGSCARAAAGEPPERRTVLYVGRGPVRRLWDFNVKKTKDVVLGCVEHYFFVHECCRNEDLG